MWKGKNLRPLSKQPEDVPHAPLIWSSDFTVALRLAAIAQVLAPASAAGLPGVFSIRLDMSN